jgi:hypothetical protein
VARGGRREGAGRKPGSALTKSVVVARKAAEAGVSPLEIMMETARYLWAQATEGGRFDARLAIQACWIAKECAPYCHPRLAAVAYQELRETKSQAQSSNLVVNVQFVTAATAPESDRAVRHGGDGAGVRFCGC